MLAAAFAAASTAAVTGSPWLGLIVGIVIARVLALLHGFACITHRGNQVVSGVAINILGCRPDHRVRHRVVPAGRPDAGAAARGALHADPLAGRDAAPRCPVDRPALCRADQRPQPDASMRRCSTVPHRALGGDEHALRPAPARGRRGAARGRHGGHLGRLAALSRGADLRADDRHRRHVSVDRAERRVQPRHDAPARASSRSPR